MWMTLLLVYLTLSLFITLALVGAAVLSGMVGRGHEAKNDLDGQVLAESDSVPEEPLYVGPAYPTAAAYRMTSLALNCAEDKDAFLRDAEAFYDEVWVWRTSSLDSSLDRGAGLFASRPSPLLTDRLR